VNIILRFLLYSLHDYGLASLLVETNPNPMRNEESPKKSRWSLTLSTSVLVALVSFVLGLLAPLILSNRLPLFPRRTGPLIGNRLLYNTNDRLPRYDCTPEQLKEFLHAEPVPGFHILCFSISGSNATEDDASSVSITTFQHAVKSNKHVEVFDASISWTAFHESVIRQQLQVRKADELKQAWALFSPEGERIMDEFTVEYGNRRRLVQDVLAAQYGMVLLYESGQFLWPGVRIGFERPVALYNIMPPDSPEIHPQKNQTVTLVTLSLSPLVISVHGFLSLEECQHIQQRAAPSMRYSEVALMDHDAGRPASDFRTSQTTFLEANNDPILIDIDYRTASLVRIPRNHQESVQVLRYGHTERYASHHDYFTPDLYRNDPSTLQLIQNGRRNRFATVFWYLSTVEEGGETVFPRFHGQREKSVEDCTTGLKVRPESGKVIIFYNMKFDGSVDPKSLHGACPVKRGVKWAANKWIWNEPMLYVPK
jgi:prolyl 4-hydroxylase